MQDVTVERFSGDRVIVVSSAAHAIGEELMIHMAHADGAASRAARVVTCRPVSVAGKLSYRLELQIDADQWCKSPRSLEER